MFIQEKDQKYEQYNDNKSQLPTNEPKRKEKQQKQKLSKQLEQEQNQRNGDHTEGVGRNGGERYREEEA